MIELVDYRGGIKSAFTWILADRTRALGSVPNWTFYLIKSLIKSDGVLRGRESEIRLFVV